ncbi:hypothetical protein [Nostoc sp. NMS4]|uniref:hypothetical protein n=1 Tax=Nostoc sp. NMS4 TaxID=2815390 RepID=UPI0025FD0E65|nr:hypothetical protein [Nostoc sp. NMS4]MBN3926021.1 hypothetical protein [Nostoc sp. NMS4]
MFRDFKKGGYNLDAFALLSETKFGTIQVTTALDTTRLLTAERFKGLWCFRFN